MKALIAMSGGVDSSVAAKCMQDAGYECIGCTMVLHDKIGAAAADETDRRANDDVEDARGVADRLKIPFHIFDFKEDFRRLVMERFSESYFEGKTPNPCVECNRHLKFGRLLRCAKELDCDVLVTGHYARIEFKDGKWILKKALDLKKDQSYVLYMLTQEQLAHVRFPLGNMTKDETRAMAELSRFGNAAKHDSQDICFVPDGDYAGTAERILGRTCPPGDFVDRTGKKLGRHRGIIHYTLGQHRWLGIELAGKRYVTAISAKTGRVTLGESEDLFKNVIEVDEVNWIAGEAPAEPVLCKAKLRYRQTEQNVKIIPVGEQRARLIFDEPQRAATPGQIAVFYDGDIVLGGGTITAAR